MNTHKIVKLFSYRKTYNASFSRKRDSMFYIKTLQQNHTPPLKSIYRKFIKQSLRFYKTGNQYIGEYMFRLLQAKKQSLKEDQKNLVEINELLDQIKTIKDKQTSNHEKYDLLQKASQDKKTTSPLFSKLKKQAKPNIIESHEIRLSLQKQNRERTLTQKMLHDFECIHHLSNILQDSMNLDSEMDFRTKQQSKLVRLSFNMSQFFTSSLCIRQGYHSLALLGCLEDDMEYEVLSDKDKQFVRDVLIKVCGPKKLNHLRYRSAIDYLKDVNAVMNEIKITRIEIAKKMIDQKQSKERTIHEEKNKYEAEDQQSEQKLKNQWKLISMEQRNLAVRNVLNQRRQSTLPDKQSTKTVKLSRQLKKSLIFQILHKTQGIHHILKPSQKLQQEICQLIRRLFKLTDEQNTSTESGQLRKEKMKYKLLEDVIIENQFIDEFINQKKIIIV